MAGSYPFDNAVFQWEDGRRRLEALGGSSTARRQADRVVGAIRDELRQRLGATFSAADLADLYGRGTDWCQQLALEVAPGAATEAQSLADAAFWLHLRGASDFAGGRRLAV